MQIITTLAGASFRPSEARTLVSHLTVGEQLDLAPDPENEYDITAVRVEKGGIHLGFIAAKDNEEIFAALTSGNPVTTEVIAFENTLKPVLEVNL